MCWYERIYYPRCHHTETPLVRYCHFARNDPGHQCFGAWNYQREYEQLDSECNDCTRRRTNLVRENGLRWRNHTY
ncbi:hypothetical protein DM02DRAFT_537781 [Periconia macrospinosa]|uniref:Uncharacterized protein n=1 Tax=Periconia macrospinosa TaxID=97972 RepID=A0A2V1DCD5_9PLEO|nr:hypothetical protein DM02DRAFT_537781 [Periconia macrospinosa]